jgi:hypothetical protein
MDKIIQSVDQLVADLTAGSAAARQRGPKPPGSATASRFAMLTAAAIPDPRPGDSERGRGQCPQHDLTWSRRPDVD